MYFCHLGKLIVHENLPSAAQTPHEAIIEARKQVRALQDRLAAEQAENKLLKQRVEDLEQRLKNPGTPDETLDGGGAKDKKKPRQGGSKKNEAGQDDLDGQGA